MRKLATQGASERGDEPASSLLDEESAVSAEADDEDTTVLSLLRPETIIVDSRRKQKSKNSKSGKKTKGKRKNSSNPKSSGNFEAAEIIEENPNRLDMIPLLQKVLVSDDNHTQKSELDVFDSIVVIFDGVSITKRPPLQVCKKGDNSSIEKETMDEDITMGRCWKVSQSNSTTTVVQASDPNSLSGVGYQSGSLAIQITGLYDEADNVIVEHIQECRSQKLDREIPEIPIDSSNSFSESKSNATRIQVMRRTERGAGKNRRLFQPLGLLRPESIACVFDFARRNDALVEQNNSDVLEHDKPKLHSSFPKLSIEGDQTLRSVRRQNPGNVFVVLDEPVEIPVDADNKADHTIVLPIVVTDDIFLRQRIVHEEGFVMTFHQLWLLLLDVI